MSTANKIASGTKFPRDTEGMFAALQTARKERDAARAECEQLRQELANLKAGLATLGDADRE